MTFLSPLLPPLSNTINHSRIPNNRATTTSHRRKREKETRHRTTGTSPRKCNTIRCLATTWRPAGVTSWFRKSGAGGGYTQISRYIWTSWTGYVCECRECTWPGDTTVLCISTGNFATMHRTWITAEDRWHCFLRPSRGWDGDAQKHPDGDGTIEERRRQVQWIEQGWTMIVRGWGCRWC